MFLNFLMVFKTNLIGSSILTNQNTDILPSDSPFSLT